jgi:ACS family hexuronate transporter-like MFS transporter
MLTLLRERKRWLITALLFFISTVAFLDKQTLSVLAKTLEQILGYSSAEYSYIVIGFMAANGLGYLFAGRLIDRFGVRLSFAVALVVWSVAAMAHSLAAGWISLLLLRIVLGLGESFYTPAAARVLREWIPQRERGVCWSVFSIGNFMGAIIAPPLVAWLALHYHWRFSFLATGATGFLLLGAWFWLYDSPERHRTLSANERAVILAGRETAPVALENISTLALLRQPRILGFFFTRFITDPFTFFFMYWLPAYLQTSHGLSLATIGAMAWIPYLGADVGALTGGAISDWLVRHGLDARVARRRLMLVIACLTPITLVAVRVDSATLAIGLITVSMLLQAAWNTNMTTLIIETTPPQHVSRVVALTLMGGTIGGIITNLLTGRVLALAPSGYVRIFTVLGFIHLIAYAVMTLGLRKSEPASRP